MRIVNAINLSLNFSPSQGVIVRSDAITRTLCEHTYLHSLRVDEKKSDNFASHDRFDRTAHFLEQVRVDGTQVARFRISAR